MAAALIPGLGPRDETPCPKPGADPVAAGLTAQEGWVFSRVDGHTSFAELFHITGLGESQTVEILKTLVQRGLVLTKNGAGTSPPKTTKPTAPIPKPSTRPPSRVATPVPQSAPVRDDGGVDRARAEVHAAQEEAAAKTGAREKAVAEEAAAQAALAQHKENMDRAEQEWKQVEARREAARHGEEQARASVQALRDSLVRAEVELTKMAAERERVARDTEAQSQRAAEVRGKAGQAVAFVEFAAKARALALSEEEAAQARVGAAIEALRVAEGHAKNAAEYARRRADEDKKLELEDLVKGYASATEAPKSKPQTEVPPPPSASAAGGAVGVDTSSDSDLPDEARKRIMRKHVRLATNDLFELLELPLDCDKRDVKRAYFKLSKEFHPDRFFGRKLGAYKEMLGEVFRAISQAAEFLTEDARRAEYQTMIRQQHEMRDLEESFAKATEAAIREAEQITTAQEAEAAPDRPVSEQPSGGFASSPAEARVSGSGKWARKGSGEYPTMPEPPPAKPASGSRLVHRMLAKNLKNDRGDTARKHFDEGHRQAESGQWVSAMHNYKLAATLVPENAEYQNKYVEAQARAAEVQAGTHAQRAEFEKSAGRFDAAARCWEHAIAAFATSAWCVEAVEMFLQIRELNKALRYGIKAVELDSANPSGHLALARVYRERKQTLDAKRAVEKALLLAPQNQEAKDLLKDLAKSA